MATQLQLRRGTTAENDVFIGAEAEVTVDTTLKQLRVHDGVTAGGIKVAKEADLTTGLSQKQDTSNLVTSISSASTDTEYPSAKLLYDSLSRKADAATTLSGYGITDGANTDLSNLTATGEAKFTAKANTDLDNLTAIAAEYIANQAMPSDSYTDLTLGASGTNYTAPADGWFFIHKAGDGSGQYLTVVNYGQINFDKFQYIGYDITGGAQLTCLMPVKKGDSVRIGYSLGGQTYSFRFIYAQGAQ